MSEAHKKNSSADHNPRGHSARYLLLFGTELLPRAALLGEEMQFLTEMIGDDGFAVDSLMRHGVPCAPPAPATLRSIDPKGTEDANLRCFALN